MFIILNYLPGYPVNLKRFEKIPNFSPKYHKNATFNKKYDHDDESYTGQ